MGLRDLAQGFSNWPQSRKGQRKGKRVGFPRFKSKNTAMRFAYSTAFTAPSSGDPYGLKLPRIGRVHCMENVHERVSGVRLIRITVSRRAGHWYASLTVEREPTAKPAPKGGAVGVDLGVKNRHLARSLSDAALGEFRRQLEYKTARSGAVLCVVDRWFPSSKTCSNCGTVKAKLSLSERTFNCDACGTSMDRDLNAAINIKVAGSAPETLNARGGDVRRTSVPLGALTSVKREPSGRLLVA